MQITTQENLPRRLQRIRTPPLSLPKTSDHVVLPTDAVENDERVRSDSKWRQTDLALPKVKFDPDVHSDMPVLNVDHE